jgi:hypothetical protein
MLINLVLDEISEKNLKCSISHAASDGSTGGIYNPMLAGQTNPLGSSNSKVSYKMDTSMIMLGLHTNIVFNINPFKQIKWNQITIEEI